MSIARIAKNLGITETCLRRWLAQDDIDADWVLFRHSYEDGTVPKKYEPGLRERAVMMVVEALPEHRSRSAAIRHVAPLLGVGYETLRRGSPRT
jgi:hypothetical protein